MIVRLSQDLGGTHIRAETFIASFSLALVCFRNQFNKVWPLHHWLRPDFVLSAIPSVSSGARRTGSRTTDQGPGVSIRVA